jgi:hypothetical protein
VFNATLQYYRGRVEHVIREVVDGRKALCTTWRGSFPLLAAIINIVVHMYGRGRAMMCLDRGQCVRRILRHSILKWCVIVWCTVSGVVIQVTLNHVRTTLAH